MIGAYLPSLRIRRVVASLAVVATLIVLSRNSHAQAAAATPAAAAKAPLVPGKFTDVTAARGINFVGVASHTSHKYLIETMGSGVAAFDYDNDGLLDLFFVNGAPLDDPMPKGKVPEKLSPKDWNRLYHQRKDGTFEDVTEKAGLKGVATAWAWQSATTIMTDTKICMSRATVRITCITTTEMGRSPM